MASIAVDSSKTTSSSLSLYLTGLDTTWDGGTRTTVWYLGRNGTPSPDSYSNMKYGDSIPNKASSGGAATFNSVLAGTKYYVACYVYLGSTLLATITGEASTLNSGSPSGWTAKNVSEAINVTTNDEMVDVELAKQCTYRFKVTFANKGLVHIYTIGDVDTYGYLSDSSAWNSDNTGPSNVLYYSDDIGNGDYNFCLDCEVKKGTYYLFIRGARTSDYGETTICVTEPWTLNSASLGTPNSSTSEEIYVEPLTLYRRSISFPKSGKVTISTSGTDVDTYGYLSDSQSWYDGAPDSWIARDDDSGGDGNFSITKEVKSGTTYYIFFKALSRTAEAGYTTLKVSAVKSESVKPDAFAWTYDKIKGEEFNLTAEEWNTFTARINAFRTYWKMDAYAFTTAIKKENFTADMYNEARLAIQDKDGYGDYILTAVKGQPVTADMMNGIVSELNAIP